MNMDKKAILHINKLFKNEEVGEIIKLIDEQKEVIQHEKDKLLLLEQKLYVLTI